MVSYAQNAEDVVLARAIPEPAGFYVDVGASDPDLASVTRHFYELGWHGINIEPRIEAIKRLNDRRPLDVNLMCAAGDSYGYIEFYNVLQDPDLSSVDRQWVDDLPGGPYEVETERVLTRTLDSIFEELKVDDIDFLKIDVEGSEGAVIRGIDLDRWKPRIVVIEAVRAWRHDRCDAPWRSLLESRGYTECLFDGINLFFARGDEPELRELLRPASALDSFQTAATVELEDRLRSLERYARHLESEIARARDGHERAKLYMNAVEGKLEERNQPISNASTGLSAEGDLYSIASLRRKALIPPPKTVRVALVGTPYAGESWLRTVLLDALGAVGISAAHPADVEWNALPNRVVLELTWRRSAYLEDVLRHHGFVVVSVARHPLDVLATAYEVKQRESMKQSEGGAAINGTKPCNAGAGEESSNAKSQEERMLGTEFFAWATSDEVRSMLSLTPSWWMVPTCRRIKYEELLLDPVPELEQLLAECDASARRNMADIVREHSLSWTCASQTGLPAQSGIVRLRLATEGDCQDLVGKLSGLYGSACEVLGYDTDWTRHEQESRGPASPRLSSVESTVDQADL